MCMMSYMVTDIQISLDTNIWIFGLFGNNMYCIRILDNLARFHTVVSNQIRIELTNNLPKPILNEFYQLVQEASVELNYEKVPEIYITMFESMGLKKGDAIIGAFAEWKKVDKIVSDNRDFLRGLSAGHYFEVMSPQEFCEEFGL
jgi:predicted nucleic acid-binding protein